jgi:hypothetical protein
MNIEITDTCTGEKATVIEPEFDEYLWTDGNYACDCNRGIFFDRGRGVQPNFDDYKCGSERFKIRVTNEGGEVVYAE